MSGWSVEEEVEGRGEMCVRTGARMNMPMKGIFESRSPSISNGASKDSTCTTYELPVSLL